MRMSRRILCTLCIAQLLTIGALAKRDKSALLPRKQAINLTKQCSRSAPEGVTATWQPTVDEIEMLELRLSQIKELKTESSFSGVQIKDPESYYMQYAGIVMGGKKYIYINAFSEVKEVPRWREQPVMVCGGGSGFWGVMYDVYARH